MLRWGMVKKRLGTNWCKPPTNLQDQVVTGSILSPGQLRCRTRPQNLSSVLLNHPCFMSIPPNVSYVPEYPTQYFDLARLLNNPLIVSNIERFKKISYLCLTTQELPYTILELIPWRLPY